jgi:hypothetical protein
MAFIKKPKFRTKVMGKVIDKEETQNGAGKLTIKDSDGIFLTVYVPQEDFELIDVQSEIELDCDLQCESPFLRTVRN